MSIYTFSTSASFLTSETIAILNDEIATLITESDRIASEAVGDTMVITFDQPLSKESLVILNDIFKTYDTSVERGDKIFSIYPFAKVGSSVYQVLARVPYKQWNLTHVELSGYMDAALSSYSACLYDPINDQVLAEQVLTNTVSGIQDLGTITNLPSADTLLEFQVKIVGGSSGNYAHVESIFLYYFK